MAQIFLINQKHKIIIKTMETYLGKLFYIVMVEMIHAHTFYHLFALLGDKLGQFSCMIWQGTYHELNYLNKYKKCGLNYQDK